MHLCVSPQLPASLHGERSLQLAIAFAAQAVVLSLWQLAQGLGIFWLSVIAGVMILKVCAATNTPGISGWIFGMWQETHWDPALPTA
jgi:hypothetical protein